MRSLRSRPALADGEVTLAPFDVINSNRPRSSGNLRKGPHSSRKLRHCDWRLGHLHCRPGAELGGHLGYKQHKGVRASAGIADRRLEMTPVTRCALRAPRECHFSAEA